MRDRLIELLDCVGRDYDDYCDECREGSGMSPMESFEEYAADYLLSKGVIVPPCKVGDTVYIIDEGDEGSDDYVLAVKVMQLFINEHGIAIDLQLPLGVRLNTWAMVGKNVFLTKEEAERALERSKE